LHPGRRELIEAYWHRWPETLGGAIEGTVEILGELRSRGTSIYALTNWSAETFPLARPRFPFLEWFHGIVVSGEAKLAKPDPRIFVHLLEKFELKAGSTVFIDDSAANVRAALETGLISILFENPLKLRTELAARGLLVG